MRRGRFGSPRPGNNWGNKAHRTAVTRQPVSILLQNHAMGSMYKRAAWLHWLAAIERAAARPETMLQTGLLVTNMSATPLHYRQPREIHA